MKTAVLSLDPIRAANAVIGERVRPGPGAAARLYRARRDLVLSLDAVRWPAWTWLDGDDDELGPALEPLIADGLPPGIAIAYGAEERPDATVPAQPWSMQAWIADPLLIHHGAVCNTRASQSIDWPDGAQWFEGVVYPQLAAIAHQVLDGVAYRWRPSANGASRWPDTGRAMVNTMRFAQGLPGVHLPADQAH